MPTTKYWGLNGPLVAVGDTHFPFHSKRCLDWVYETIAEINPAYITQVGDLHDNFSLSKFAKSLNLMTPAREFELGNQHAKDMWSQLCSIAPKAKKYQIMGNHDERAEKRLMEKCPELEALVDLESRYHFDGVTTIHDTKEELWIGDIAVMHGYKSNGAHARHNQAPTIVGHLHTGRVEFFQNRQGVYWELNAGFIGDINSPVFNYRNQKAIHGWTLGLGVVDENGPRFIPYRGKV